MQSTIIKKLLKTKLFNYNLVQNFLFLYLFIVKSKKKSIVDIYYLLFSIKRNQSDNKIKIESVYLNLIEDSILYL